jgi:CubicO group peptidase (beta-lactamase class C family)
MGMRRDGDAIAASGLRTLLRNLARFGVAVLGGGSWNLTELSTTPR